MNRKRIFSLFLLILLVFSTLIFCDCIAANSQQKRVLFINSYSYTSGMAPYKIEGIRDGLGEEAVLDVVFMDAETVDDYVSRDLFYKTLEHKISVTGNYDAVITGDDAAYDFASDHYYSLFNGKPMIFEGVSNIDSAMMADKNSFITGIVEEHSYKENFELALKINPKAKKVVALVDNTVAGLGEKNQFYKQKSEYPQLKFSEINGSELSKKDIEEKIASVKEDTLFFYLILSEDKDGNKFTTDYVCKMISDNLKVPAYRFVYEGIGKGVLGGKVISYEKTGREAGKIVKEIFDGRKIDDVAVRTVTPSEYCFDGAVMEKFNINRNLIPEDSVIINDQNGFFGAFGYGLSVTAVLVIVLIFLIILLFKFYMMKKKYRHPKKNNIRAFDTVPEEKIIFQGKEKKDDDEKSLSHKHILLAEDNNFNAEITTELLNLENMTVEHVKNGKEAVYQFVSSRPGTYDAILMDIQMPVMDGYEATDLIRNSKHPQAMSIPILAMTSNSFQSDISKAAAHKMDSHIAKPLDTQELYRKLKKYIFNNRK